MREWILNRNGLAISMLGDISFLHTILGKVYKLTSLLGNTTYIVHSFMQNLIPFTKRTDINMILTSGQRQYS